MTMTPDTEKLKALAAVSEPNQRKCSCHPDDAPVPCQHEHALTHCKLKASQAIITQLQSELAALKAQGTFNDGVEAAAKYCEEELVRCLNDIVQGDVAGAKVMTAISTGLYNAAYDIRKLSRPTSQIQGEVGKEFPAKGEGE